MWIETRADRTQNGLKPSLSLAPSEVGQREPSGRPWVLLLQRWWEGEGGSTARVPSPGRLSSNRRGESGCPAHPLLTLQQDAGPSAGSLTRARLPSCHLPLQSISGSCMWVTQQHCSQAQEAAAELKGWRRSSEHCTPLSLGSLKGYSRTVLPFTLGDFRIFK